MKFHEYNFQNIYVITTYKCNYECTFCLFRHNLEKECSLQELKSNLKNSILDSKKQVYIKITGGEPFIYTKSFKPLIEIINKNKDKIYKVGIGTNGSIKFPKILNTIKVKTKIFLSRHQINSQLSSIQKLTSNIHNTLISYHYNCNMIKGQVDSIKK